MQRIATRLVSASMLALLIVAAAATERPSMAAEGPARGVLPRRVRRLPANYNKVVTDPQQKEKIFQIQDEYRTKMGSLEQQLAALRKERDEKIAAVLSPEQKKQIDEAAANEKAAREAKAKEKAAKKAEAAPKAPAAKPEK